MGASSWEKQMKHWDDWFAEWVAEPLLEIEEELNELMEKPEMKHWDDWVAEEEDPGGFAEWVAAKYEQNN